MEKIKLDRIPILQIVQIQGIDFQVGWMSSESLTTSEVLRVARKNGLRKKTKYGKRFNYNYQKVLNKTEFLWA